LRLSWCGFTATSKKPASKPEAQAEGNHVI
jgi:hypothetical protein